VTWWHLILIAAFALGGVAIFFTEKWGREAVANWKKAEESWKRAEENWRCAAEHWDRTAAAQQRIAEIRRNRR
jgi:hypothetical protein